ncbi:hypothetical protein [Deinococcus sp. SL84]|uniref:hypothetical protein n=1 Tax=Deinococcus sp. SL84 TaxID=2994663 RepID=UPI0022750729|nr:hypothetical protein [Deinococcus sp. SL84]MCY1703704.1 hypothetical protein [Deinococcus sp. SL84]
MKSLLLLTDFHYAAKSRAYAAEDLFLSQELGRAFHVASCHPKDSEPFEDGADVILFRNAGPVADYAEEYGRFRSRLLAKGHPIFNSLDGQGDMQGKQYLIDLTKQQYPVIPTVERLEDMSLLPITERYLTKPKHGADSHGVAVLDRQTLLSQPLPTNTLVQPWVEFEYEVSFYYLNNVFQYALYAPNKQQRWALERYTPTSEDLSFAERFIDWNAMKHGIQRVDACRTLDGQLLLVEHEDLNPFLSLDLLDTATRRRFVDTLIDALQSLTGP